MATDWNNYYQKVLSNPTATEEAKTEARNRLGLNVDNQGGSTGSLQGTMTQDSNQQGTTGTSNLSNLRLALRSALTEASQKKAASRIGMLSPMIQGGSSPDVIKSAIGLAQSGLRQTQEQMFSDIMESYKEADKAKKEELDKIAELRLEFGSAIPANITNLNEAITLATPLIDAKNALEKQETQARIDKMKEDVANAKDVESWASGVADGTYTISSVPSGIRTQVSIRADEIKSELEAKAKQEYKDRIKLNIDNKISDYDAERSNVLTDPNLTVSEVNEIIEYIDSLEAQNKEEKGKSNPLVNEIRQNFNSNPLVPTTPLNDRINQIKSEIPNISRFELETRLQREGYNLEDIRKVLPAMDSKFFRLFK